IRFYETPRGTVVAATETDARNERQPAEVGVRIDELMERIQAKKVVIGIERTALQVDGLIARFCGDCTVQIGGTGGCLVEDGPIYMRCSCGLATYFWQADCRFLL